MWDIFWDISINSSQITNLYFHTTIKVYEDHMFLCTCLHFKDAQIDQNGATMDNPCENENSFYALHFKVLMHVNFIPEFSPMHRLYLKLKLCEWNSKFNFRTMQTE